MSIHETAKVSATAEIADTAEIGPFCVIEDNVKIGAGTKLISNVVIMSDVSIGENNVFYPFCVIGGGAQHLKYMNDKRGVVIGNNNVFREAATVHAGSPISDHPTKIGNDNFIMVSAHIGHDDELGNNIVLTNNVMLAGHVHVYDGAILGGGAAVHQFCRVGQGAMVGGMTGISRDVLPYAMVTGDRGFLRGLNLVGLKRRGIEGPALRELYRAYNELFKAPGSFEDRVAKVSEKYKGNEKVGEWMEFIKNAGPRGILIDKGNAGKDE